MWRGTIIRIYENQNNYDDYMIAHIPSDNAFFYLINVTVNNTNDNGATLCSVKIDGAKSINTSVEQLKFSVGTQGVSVLTDEK